MPSVLSVDVLFRLVSRAAPACIGRLSKKNHIHMVISTIGIVFCTTHAKDRNPEVGLQPPTCFGSSRPIAKSCRPADAVIVTA